MAAVQYFRLQPLVIISDFQNNYIINVDQTGCQYQTAFNRILDDDRKFVGWTNNPDLYDETFQDNENEPRCTKVLLNVRPLVQPYEVYFFRILNKGL
ncbi:hypothetical protein ABEB36_005199 [Hypothenemus hampei]|uniref:Uncharacterized protein n=1 Tax=Hypothenemus hampei TaxID=57062 RepID=A0ABD1F181_HYPHA